MSTDKALFKFSGTAGKSPASADLVAREIAVNTADGKLYTKRDSGVVVLINPDNYVWNGSSQKTLPTTTTYAASGTTDSNGRIVFNITKDGTSTGAAIFSSVYSIQATGVSKSTTDITKFPHSTIEATTTVAVTVRLILPQALLALGNPVVFAGAGYTCYLTVIGAAN